LEHTVELALALKLIVWPKPVACRGLSNRLLSALDRAVLAGQLRRLCLTPT
tara:strand:+ start:201 stop:353 length:153 start_codon:yes stop_codon:yes gene_type:complete